MATHFFIDSSLLLFLFGSVEHTRASFPFSFLLHSPQTSILLLELASVELLRLKISSPSAFSLRPAPWLIPMPTPPPLRACAARTARLRPSPSLTAARSGSTLHLQLSSALPGALAPPPTPLTHGASGSVPAPGSALARPCPAATRAMNFQ